MKVRLEQSLLKLFVFFSVGYQLLQLTYDFLFTDYILIAQLENVMTAFLYLLILYFAQKSSVRQINALAVYLVAAASLSIEWLLFGGFESSMPYNAVLLMMVIIISSRATARIVSLSLFAVLLLVLLLIDHHQRESSADLSVYPSRLTLILDFLLHGLFITIITLVLKQKFDSYRTKIVRHNEELSQLDQEIAQKNQKLAYQQAEIQSLNASLEKRIEQKVNKIREKNHRLAEYAYINAHHLRGPVCKIMGLAELMEETTPEDTVLADTIRKRAEELDEIIKQINTIVS